LSLTDGDTTVQARRLAARKPGEGMVVARSSRSPDVVRASAVVRTRGMSVLALSLITAFSVSEGIRKDTGIISWVRWPDRVVIGAATVGRGGASLVSQGRGGRSIGERAILEMSVNRLRSRMSSAAVTSLEKELGAKVDEQMLLGKMLESLSWMHFGWTNGMQEHVMKRVSAMTETIGTKVSFVLDGKRLSGLATEVDPSGRLLVEVDAGKTMVELTDADELLE
jgi:biotin-(acetyl-CoA carboxylase) ligase